MSALTTRILPIALLCVVIGVVGTAVTWSILASSKPGDGPADVVWDKAACAACGMHVGEPPFAAQLTTQDGKLHVFDDPGCLFLWIDENRPDVHTTFFRHHGENRWIPRSATGFVTMEKTPMGFGLAAVDATQKGAIDCDDAAARCRKRAGGHGDGR